ncbi:MAG TPA: HAMP domain-containing sensor histidine kinase [Gaiellaceae bacterium]
MRSLLPLRSLTVKLGVVVFALVFLSIGVLLLVVMPRIESRLVDARIDRLERVEPAFETRLPKLSVEDITTGNELSVLGSRYDTRVTVLTPLSPTALGFFADSTPLQSSELTHDPVALQTLRTGKPARDRVERGDRSFAEVAFPVGDAIVLLSAPLGDVLRSFDLMRRSLLIAGGLALLVAAFVAYGAAWGLTRRLRSLETAAERIAAGDFSQPVVDRGRDEVAQLAVAFENMRERLSHLERARREFIQNASHELRTPLFSLAGFLELMDDEDLDEGTRREFLVETRAQVDRLAKLATDLLDLSRLDAGQLEVVREDVDLAEIARTAGDEFRVVAESSDHELRTNADGCVAASADSVRTLQIVRVLVENALRHTPEGTPVEIAAGTDEQGASIEVRDAGPGISPDALPYLFERFYRAGGGRTSGSGLGLAIASELAQKMEGELTVSSRPGETVFRLTLPAGSDAGDALVSHENGESALERAASPV